MYLSRSNHILRQIYSDIREAIAGTDKDFTEINIFRAVFILSVPMILEMLMESFFSIADIYFVSRLGPDAMAAIGLTESLMTIVYAIGMGLATGTTAIISRRIGEKKRELAAVSAVQAIITGLLVSLIIAVPSAIFAGDILRLMGAGEAVVREGKVYAAIILGGNGIIMLLFINNAIFRSAGDAAISMRVLFLANILNIILDPCLIFGLGPFPELGIKGAAIATTIGRGLAVIYQFYLLFRGNTRIII
ncbi:MAG: MATE family efflux transporter, partial [Bacteroidales bacterium]